MSPFITSINPPSLVVGPPADTALFVYGQGFEAGSLIWFGGQQERTDYLTNALSTIITQGMFPNQDPSVPVWVVNPDGSQSNTLHFAFVPFNVVPPEPTHGSLQADLDTMRIYIGARSNQDDVLLQGMLYAATEWWYERVYQSHQAHPDVQLGILMRASRLYKRRQSPEGIAGFGGEGAVVRLVRGDPDEEDLLERHMDYSRVGIG